MVEWKCCFIRGCESVNKKWHEDISANNSVSIFFPLPLWGHSYEVTLTFHVNILFSPRKTAMKQIFYWISLLFYDIKYCIRNIFKHYCIRNIFKYYISNVFIWHTIGISNYRYHPCVAVVFYFVNKFEEQIQNHRYWMRIEVFILYSKPECCMIGMKKCVIGLYMGVFYMVWSLVKIRYYEVKYWILNRGTEV